MKESRTVSEIAKLLGVDRPAAYGLLQFLCAKGLANAAGTRREPGQRGKGQHLYTFIDGIDEVMVALMRVL